MKYFIINGRPRSGKDTFVNFCIEELGAFGKLISTVDFVKKIATECGWDGTKDLKNRKFLSDLKDLLTNWADVPYTKTMQEIKLFYYDLEYYDVENSGVVFIMSREPEEISRFEKELGAKSILIRRNAVEFNKQSNHADSEVLNHKYHYIIDNNDTLEELKIKAKEFCNYIKNEL